MSAQILPEAFEVVGFEIMCLHTELENHIYAFHSRVESGNNPPEGQTRWNTRDREESESLPGSKLTARTRSRTLRQREERLDEC